MENGRDLRRPNKRRDRQEEAMRAAGISSQRVRGTKRKKQNEKEQHIEADLLMIMHSFQQRRHRSSESRGRNGQSEGRKRK